MRLKIGLLGGLLSLLGGCSVLPAITTPINATEVFTLENSYGVAQSVAVAYSALPRCAAGTSASPTNVCAKQAIIASLATDNHKALIALGALEAFVRNPANYPNLSYSALAAAAYSTVSQFSALETQDGVK